MDTQAIDPKLPSNNKMQKTLAAFKMERLEIAYCVAAGWPIANFQCSRRTRDRLTSTSYRWGVQQRLGREKTLVDEWCVCVCVCGAQEMF